MSTSSEKLVYLQNGVFKRKEMATGLQYYHNGARPSHYRAGMAPSCSAITTTNSPGLIRVP